MNYFFTTTLLSKTAVLLLAFVIAMALPTAPAAAELDLGYTKVYEPQTSLSLSATVLWQADDTVLEAAREESRPSSALVYVDEALRVRDEQGKEIASHLSDYLEATSQAFIPALYVRDEKAAQALQAYLMQIGKKDVFAVVAYADKALLVNLVSLPHIRGIVDFREMDASTEEELMFILRTTNGSRAKIALLSDQTATQQAVEYLQKRLLTVWAQTQSSQVDLIAALTRGVNGIVVSDYQAANAALSFFNDEAPTLLRVPLIVGHRGMPSEYVENTLMSAKGAADAGADVIENDIYLSRDNELFINHDPSLKRLYDRSDIRDTEALTLEELQAIPYSFSGMNGVTYANHTKAANSRYGKIAEDPSLRIPALKEYYEAFQDTDIVHFVEIKSHNPEIVTVLKELSREMGTQDQTVVISFNVEILEEIHRVWPEMSLGALGTEGANFIPGRPGFMDYTAIMKGEGKEKALELLYKVLQPYNATYNPKFTYTYDLVSAGRHRGLTVWPWTYNDPKVFAQDYLRGIYGLTTNFAWWGSDMVTKVSAQDQTLKVGESVQPPQLLNQKSEEAKGADQAELLVLSGTSVKDGKAVEAGRSVLIWRSRQTLEIDNKNYGDYYLYSQPFSVTAE